MPTDPAIDNPGEGVTRHFPRQRVAESPIQAIRRAVAILGLFSDEHPELSLGDLVRRSGLGKTTTHRYAVSLREEGLLRYNRETAQYSLGSSLIRLGRLAQASMHITDIATPHMDAVATEIQETVALAVLDAGLPIVVKVSYPPSHNVFVAVSVGDRQSLGSAHALVMKAYQQGGASREPALVKIRSRGYAVADYAERGISAVACPILQVSGLIATLAAVGTTKSITGRLEAIANRLGLAAQRIAADIGEPPAA